MTWLAFQSSFLLTYETLVYTVYFVHLSQVSPMQVHLYTMILQFPPLFSEKSKAALGRSNLGSGDCTESDEVFLENSHEQSL